MCGILFVDVMLLMGCCLPSETNERNGATPIFRSFLCFFYIILSTTVSFWTLRMPYYFYKVSFLVHIPFFCMCVMYLTDSFNDRRSLNGLSCRGELRR